MTSSVELEALRELARNRLVLELGSHRGVTAIAMAATAERVHCVDHFFGDPHTGMGTTLADFLRATRPVPNIVTHIGDFKTVLPALRDRTFGLIFVDGYHTPDAVERDIKLSQRLLAPDGIYAFHDYTITAFGVREVVDTHFTVDQIVETLAVVNNP